MEKQIVYNYITINCINGKQYIGTHSTNKVDDGYLGTGLYILNAIKKYGKENFKRKILCECKTMEEAFANEVIYIKEYNSLEPNGYNISPTGGLRVPNCHSEKTKNKMCKAQQKRRKNNPVSEETKRKTSESTDNRGIKNPMYGRTAWNKGLTKETDMRLKKVGESISRTKRNKKSNEKNID